MHPRAHSWKQVGAPGRVADASPLARLLVLEEGIAAQRHMVSAPDPGTSREEHPLVDGDEVVSPVTSLLCSPGTVTDPPLGSRVSTLIYTNPTKQRQGSRRVYWCNCTHSSSSQSPSISPVGLLEELTLPPSRGYIPFIPDLE